MNLHRIECERCVSIYFNKATQGKCVNEFHLLDRRNGIHQSRVNESPIGGRNDEEVWRRRRVNSSRRRYQADPLYRADSRSNHRYKASSSSRRDETSNDKRTDLNTSHERKRERHRVHGRNFDHRSRSRPSSDDHRLPASHRSRSSLSRRASQLKSNSSHGVFTRLKANSYGEN